MGGICSPSDQEKADIHSASGMPEGWTWQSKTTRLVGVCPGGQHILEAPLIVTFPLALSPHAGILGLSLMSTPRTSLSMCQVRPFVLVLVALLLDFAWKPRQCRLALS